MVTSVGAHVASAGVTVVLERKDPELRRNVMMRLWRHVQLGTVEAMTSSNEDEDEDEDGALVTIGDHDRCDDDDIPVLREEVASSFRSVFQYGSSEWKTAVVVVIAAIVVTAGLGVYDRVSPRPPVVVECK